MEPLVSAWNSLSPRRRVVVALAAAGMLAALVGIARLSSRPDMALLYAGLDPVAAGQVLAALDADGAAYQVRGPAIYVDSGRRDMLRMALAAQGLPAAGAEGYELLDSLSGFGTTAQMFDAAYWRAREGELARTILASPDIRAARVHISPPSGRPFDRGTPPTASLAVTPAGGPISADLARALRFLVAAAVTGLTPDNVSVIDSRTGTVIGADPSGVEPSEREEALRQNVQRLVEARVGPGRAVVEVSVEVLGDSESITERQIDPASRVQISTETEERTNTASDQGSPGVTVASNLPSGDGTAGGQSQSQGSETRERVNFDVSETRREVHRAPGGIKRITVAVLVDGIRTTDAAGAETWAPRPDEELAALRDLVASAVGFSEARQDSITIRSMEFPPLPELGSTAEAAPGTPLDVMLLAQLGTFAVVALVLGLFVLRPALTARPALEPAGLPPPDPLADPPGALAGALTGTIDDGAPPLAMVADIEGFAPMAGIEDDPVARLRRLIEERREETMETLRSWVEAEETT